MRAVIRKVEIRNTHPALYRALMVLGFMGIALGFNFWFSTPTFNPYGVSKNIIGVIFFTLGLTQIAFLNLFHDLRIVRLNLAVSVSWMFFWGVSNTEQYFAGNSSLQLPILFLTLSILQIPLLTESPVNPMTERKNGGY